MNQRLKKIPELEPTVLGQTVGSNQRKRLTVRICQKFLFFILLFYKNGI